jgi:hypothetical protein
MPQAQKRKKTTSDTFPSSDRIQGEQLFVAADRQHDGADIIARGIKKNLTGGAQKGHRQGDSTPNPRTRTITAGNRASDQVNGVIAWAANESGSKEASGKSPAKARFSGDSRLSSGGRITATSAGSGENARWPAVPQGSALKPLEPFPENLQPRRTKSENGINFC